MEHTIESLRRLNDDRLLAEMRTAIGRERNATSYVVLVLAEVDARKLYVSQGYSCLRAFCTGEFQLTHSEAANRVRAARAIRRFPAALHMLANGALTLTNLYLLAPHLTTDNHIALLKAAQYKTKRDVQDQVAALYPDREQRVLWNVRVRRNTDDKLHRAQDLLRHVIPNGDIAEVLDRALTELIAHCEKQKLGSVSRPRRAQKAALSPRYIPRRVKRLVWQRDEARCTFIGPQGRCTETGLLEFHHIVPVAFGGASTVDNVQVRCRAHNQFEMEKDFPRAPESAPKVTRSSPPSRARRRRTRGP